MKLTQLQAEAVWAHLVDICGADKEGQADFVRAAQEKDGDYPSLEYRFQGSLGFGGKVYLDDPPRVSCYPEDETPARNKQIKSVNDLLLLDSGKERFIK